MITSLTEEQEAKMPEYRDKWIEIGLSTEPLNIARATEAIHLVYKCRDLEPPECIFLDSPMAVLTARAQIALGRDLDLEPALLGDQYGNEPPITQTRVSKCRIPELAPEASTDPQLQKEISNQASVTEWCHGQHDANWLSFYDYFIEVCNVEIPQIAGLISAAKEVGWFNPCRDVCFVSARPSVLHRDEEGRLHCTDGPALSYPDGWSIYSLNGVRVPEWLVETPARDLDAREFAKLTNVEIRREFVRKVGIERIAEDCGSETLDTVDDYALLMVDLGGETGKWPYLKMRNPSIGVWHLEAVPRECRTVQQALEARNGGAFVHIRPMT